MYRPNKEIFYLRQSTWSPPWWWSTQVPLKRRHLHSTRCHLPEEDCICMHSSKNLIYFLLYFSFLHNKFLFCTLPSSNPPTCFLFVFFPVHQVSLLLAGHETSRRILPPSHAYNSIQTDRRHFTPWSPATLPAVQYHLQFLDRYRIRVYYEVPVTSGIKLRITPSCVSEKEWGSAIHNIQTRTVTDICVIWKGKADQYVSFPQR
jgi:hypothetical protein